MNLVIGPMGDDGEQWERLFRAYGVFYGEDFPPAVVTQVRDWMENDAHGFRAFLARADGRVVGFAHLRRHADTFTAGSGWVLEDLFVDEGSRGAGIARALIEACASHARDNGGGTLRWITARDNTTAQALYDKVATRSTWLTYERET